MHQGAELIVVKKIVFTHLIRRRKIKPMASIRNIITFSLSVALLLGTAGAIAGDSRDPRAEALLKKMGEYMGSLKSFSADAHMIEDQIMGDGFKMAVLQSGAIKVQRPDKFHILRTGEPYDQEIFYNGSHLSILDKGLDRYIDIAVTGNLDAVLDAADENFDARLPGHDLFSTDAYASLMEPVEESTYLRAVEVNGVTCRHLAFRSDEVDWQLWILEGDTPLPCRYTITSKWINGAPQYTVSYTNWKLNPVIPSAAFDFTAPDDAKPMTMKEYRETLGSQGDK